MTHKLLMARAGSSTFSPLSLSPFLMVDSNDSADFTFSSGSIVSQWNDLSGNGRHFTSSGTPEPTRTGTQNGRPTVVFDGVNDYMVTAAWAAISQPTTIVTVAQFDSIANPSHYLYDGLGTSNRHAIISGTGYGTINHFAGIEAQAGAKDLNWHIFAVEYNGASTRVRIDGGAASTIDVGTQTLTGLTLASRFSIGDRLNGEVAHLFLKNAALSLADLNSLGSYLGGRWGVTWTTAT